MNSLLEFGAARYLMVVPLAPACAGWRRMRYKSGESGKASMPNWMLSTVKGTVTVDCKAFMISCEAEGRVKYARRGGLPGSAKPLFELIIYCLSKCTSNLVERDTRVIQD